MQKHRFYVYTHARRCDGSVFYVGKGCRHRAWVFSGRSEQWNAAASSGVVVSIFMDGLTEDEAHLSEKTLIMCFGRKNLCNKTNGGGGMSGWKMPDETKARLSCMKKGWKHSDDSKRAMSEKRRGVPKSREHVEAVSKSLKGRKFSEQHRAALSKAMHQREFNPEWGKKSGESRSKKVFCHNNGIVYKSTKDAALSLGLMSCSVSRVANKIYNNTKGYRFSYVEQNRENSGED